MIANLLVQIGIPKQFTGDVIVAILFILLTIVITTLVKKKNLGALLISIYISYALLTKLFFDFAQDPYVKAIIFIVCMVIFFSLLKKYVRIKIKGQKISKWIKTSLASLTIVGFLVSIVLQWIPSQIINEFITSYSATIFLTKEAQLVWIIAPLVMIFLLKNKQ